MHIAVLGAGIVGMTTAYALARHGHRVTIIDKANAVAAGATYANGAQLSYSFVDPMASPEMLKKIPAILMGRDPNSQQDLSFQADHLKWGAHFIGNCLEPKVARNLDRAIQLAIESRDAMARLLEHHAISFRYRKAGKLVVTRNENSFRRMCHAAEVKSARGVEANQVTPQDCWHIEPILQEYYPDIVGGIYAPGDYVGDARRFTSVLAQICTEEYGVQIKLNQKVAGLASDQDKIIGVRTHAELHKADAVVVCLGAASAQFLKQYNIPLLIEPIKGYSFTIPASDTSLHTSLTDADNKLVFARLDQEIRIAGLADYDGEDLSLKAERLNRLKSIAKGLLPEIGDYSHSGLGWVGARPMTPDGLPVTSATKLKGLYLNTGHGMLGWTLACGSAERLADIVTEGSQQENHGKRAAIS